MEDSMTAMLFAEDVMCNFLVELDEEWSSPEGINQIATSVTSCFNEEVATAVYSTYKAKFDIILACQEEMKNEGLVIDHRDFARLALEAAPEYFPHGYTPPTFVAFCAMVMGVAYLFKNERSDELYLDSAAGVVSTVLIGHMLCGDFTKEGGWICLTVASTVFNSKHAKAESRKKDIETGSSERKDSGEGESNFLYSVIVS